MEIERLFDKLVNRELSEKEIDELANSLQEKTPSDEMNKHFIKIWDKSQKYTSELDSDILLNSIHNKLNISSDSKKMGKKTFHIPGLLKYAAIIIVVFSLSWFLNNQYKKHFVAGRVNNTGVHEVTVAQGSKSKIKLSDGSVVRLNSGSKLTYPAFFNDKNRQVYLEGEAYFEVNADSSRPFFVNTSDITVKVVGTSFNLKSYPESNTIETILVSGSLEIFDKLFIGSNVNRSVKPMILKPNQKAIYIKDRQKLTLEDRRELKLESDQMKVPKLSLQDQIDTHASTAWKDGKLIFKEDKFEDLAIKLERWYNVKIIIKSQKLKKERFTGIFENETTEQVLNALMMAEPFEYTMNKNIITIYDSEKTP